MTQGTGSCGYYIGGRYFPPSPYCKYNQFIGTAQTALVSAKARRGNLFPKGYNKPFPFKINNNACTINYNQVNNPYILNSYYQDGNNTNYYPCNRGFICGNCCQGRI